MVPYITVSGAKARTEYPLALNEYVIQFPLAEIVGYVILTKAICFIEFPQ